MEHRDVRTEAGGGTRRAGGRRRRHAPASPREPQRLTPCPEPPAEGRAAVRRGRRAVPVERRRREAARGGAPARALHANERRRQSRAN